MIISIYNIKGGVGKTSTTINLAYNAAKMFKVLIWDLDPQGATTFYLQKKTKNRNYFEKFNKNGIEKYIKTTDFPNLDLIPADLDFKDIDKVLDNNKHFKDLLNGLEYDYIFLDSPPTLSHISKNIFKASDTIVVPTIPTVLSIRTYNQILDIFKDYLKNKNIFTFLSMVDKRKKMHIDLANKILSLPKKQVLKTPIYNSSIVEKMGEELAPVEVFAPNSEASVNYNKLWEELKEKI